METHSSITVSFGVWAGDGDTADDVVVTEVDGPPRVRRLVLRTRCRRVVAVHGGARRRYVRADLTSRLAVCHARRVLSSKT